MRTAFNLWTGFLDSLATRGGNLFILLAMNITMFCFVMHILHHGDHGDVASMIQTTFSNFSGAMLHALISGDKNASTIQTLGLNDPKEGL